MADETLSAELRATVTSFPAMSLPTLAPWFRRLQTEILPLAVLGLAGLSAFAFLDVADEVVEGEARRFDLAVLYALRTPGDPAQPIGPAWLRIAAADLTALGSVTDLAMVVFLVAGLFVSLGRWRTALLLVLASGGAVALSQALKLVYGRERPPLGLHAVEVVNASFPSGHAMLSAAVYLGLGVLVARLVRLKRIKALALGWAIVLTTLIGLSRVYLGVHWPTDVLAGWCVGAAWAAAWWLVAHLLERRWPELRREEASAARKNGG